MAFIILRMNVLQLQKSFFFVVADKLQAFFSYILYKGICPPKAGNISFLLML